MIFLAKLEKVEFRVIDILCIYFCHFTNKRYWRWFWYEQEQPLSLFPLRDKHRNSTMWAKGETKLISIVSKHIKFIFFKRLVKKNYDQNIYVKKFLDIRIFLVNQIFWWTNFLAKKNVFGQQNIGQTKFLVKKSWSKICL